MTLPRYAPPITLESFLRRGFSSALDADFPPPSTPLPDDETLNEDVSWDFVVKVKYGNTLKRFNGGGSGDSMDLDMNTLRNKIFSLFDQLDRDSELMLTYVDSDGDHVALENDDELCDAVITQYLSPLRINVHLKSETGGGPGQPSQFHYLLPIAIHNESCERCNDESCNESCECCNESCECCNDESCNDNDKNNWDFVIKVIYGDTLKRFNGSGSGDLMELDMNMLRNKILSLFHLDQDSELVLTYVDDDAEHVTLENDDELRDAVIIQYLSPLRINVHLKSETSDDLWTPSSSSEYGRSESGFPYPEFNNPHFFPTTHINSGREKPAREMLKGCFIQDETVLDGTIIPPSTPFTKIWRIKNYGNTRWPYGTRLVWIGGENFANTNVVQLEIQSDGFPVDEEIDIAVDFTSPLNPGCYVSYWRLESPSGQKFGQCVWVLIQVDNSDLDPEPVVFPPQVPTLLKEPVETSFADNILTSSPESVYHDAASDKSYKSETSSVDSVHKSETDKQSLLEDLEKMGFKEFDLRQNEFDLEIEDLDDEWDHITFELNEMGFSGSRTRNY